MFSFFLFLPLFLSLTLAKINAFNLNPSPSKGGFSSRDHCFAAFLTGAIDLINSNFRSESPNGKQMWAGAALAKQCLSSKRYWNIILPCLQQRWREKQPYLWGALRLQEGHARAGPQESPGRLTEIWGHWQHSFVPKATYWGCVSTNVWMGERGERWR